MKRFWFRRRLLGFGWYPASVEGWLVLILYFAALGWIFSNGHYASGSVHIAFRDFILPVWALTAILLIAAACTGEYPHWQWGKRKVFVEDVLLGGGVAVIPTDTTYGLVASALNERAVHEVYRLRKRDLGKPLIILIADRKDLKKFGVKLSAEQKKILSRVWPGAVSVILPCHSERFAYLHRGGGTLAFRLPAKRELRNLLRYAGPLAAPSANPQGLPVARLVAEAKSYFGHHVNFYQDGGAVIAKPSRLIDITDGAEKVLRG